MDIVVATRNKNKLVEIRALLEDTPLNVLSLNDFKSIPTIREDGRTLEENAKKKAIKISSILKALIISDDSGLEIEHLGGKPGVRSARFAGRGATYKSNNEKVLRLLKDIPLNKRKALFRCIIAIADRGRLVGIAEGRCRGKIGVEPKGRSGFGYDPIFIPHGHKKTFAQIGIREKNKISHRSKALIKAKKIIERYLNSTVKSRFCNAKVIMS